MINKVFNFFNFFISQISKSITKFVEIINSNPIISELLKYISLFMVFGLFIYLIDYLISLWKN